MRLWRGRLTLRHGKIFLSPISWRAKDQVVSELEAVNTQQPIASQEEHRVLKFRPRTTARPPERGYPEQRPGDDAKGEPGDLSRYEQARDEPDDFRQRMLANVAAFAFTVALTAVGIWLAMSIADLRNTQDCVLMGRRDCAHISTPHF
jgi:hypothetical protein